MNDPHLYFSFCCSSVPLFPCSWLYSRKPGPTEHSLMTSLGESELHQAPGTAAGAGPHPGSQLLPGCLQSALYIRDTPHWSPDWDYKQTVLWHAPPVISDIRVSQVDLVGGFRLAAIAFRIQIAGLSLRPISKLETSSKPSTKQCHYSCYWLGFMSLDLWVHILT